jgi:hypothetical protein
MRDVVIIGFEIDEGWNACSSVTGYIGHGGATLGGHAVLGCYYDGDGFGFENSWAKTWGRNGFGRMTWKQFDEQFLYALAVSF